MIHIFTSITSNYIPKARVLAATLKKYHPDFNFHVLLSDKLPENFKITDGLFDSIINITELDIPDFKSWVFKHTIVELCTAVKGFGFLEIFKRYQADKIIYFDPDIVILSPIDSIIEKLSEKSILLTPHVTEMEQTEEAVMDNEICSLKHGVFNLGFLGVRRSEEGMKFLQWWSQRLSRFCYDDIPGGLFTDQRWADLVPCLFNDVGIMREPIYNVATWNLTQRSITGSPEDAEGIWVNNERLCFYHFSGFDSGAQLQMLNKYAKNSTALIALREWYIKFCLKMGQTEFEKIPFYYGYYSNGKPIKKQHRIYYRQAGLSYGDPFMFFNPHFNLRSLITQTKNVAKSFFHSLTRIRHLIK
jgi:hypothetical protein